MNDLLVYLNGEMVKSSSACISVSDAGFLHGASTFTTMLAKNSKVFRLDRHLRRLGQTVNVLGIKADATVDTLVNAVDEVLRANALADARVRITLTPGPVREGRPTTLVTAEPVGDLPRQWCEKGISVVVTSLKAHKGDFMFGYKTGCYLGRMLARSEAAAKGADDALWFTDQNYLSEACTSNVFLVLDGKVFTPPRDTPVLPGIVREAVLELCGELGIPADDQTPLTVREMLAAQEAFLTASVAGIRPGVRIERHSVGDEKPGEITCRLMKAYEKLLARECA